MKSPVVKRSIVIAGHKTSVSLEDAFWTGLKEIAAERHITLSDMVETNSFGGHPVTLGQRGGQPESRASADAVPGHHWQISTASSPGSHRRARLSPRWTMQEGKTVAFPLPAKTHYGAARLCQQQSR